MLMIYDFSCNAVHSFLSQLDQLLPALGTSIAALVVITGMSALGALAFRRTTFRVTDIFCGWAIVAAFMTLVAVLFTHALFYAAVVLAVVMLLSLLRVVRSGYFKAPFWLLALFPGLVVLTALNLLGISGWDDFSHWVPNALYVFHFDGVPGTDLAASRSAWPSYPYAVPFVTYLASKLAGGFLMQGGAMFNFLLLLAFAVMLAQTNLTIKNPESKPTFHWRTVGFSALALLLVTLGNPSFNASFTMSNQGDTSTMVLIGALGLLLAQLIDALKQKWRKNTQDIVLQIALTATALVLVKPVGIFLFVMLLFAFLVVAFKNKVLKAAAKNLPLLVLPALVMNFVWTHYVGTHMGGKGFGVLPFAQWHFALIGPILKAMVQTMVKDNGLFIITFVTIGAGIRALFQPATSLRNFALLSALVCGGYIVFLFLTYVGSTFSEDEIRRAASFYRYATHIGFLGTAYIWFAAPPGVWNKLIEKNKPGSTTLSTLAAKPALQKSGFVFIISALPLVLLFQSHWLIRGTVDRVCQYRELARKIAHVLPDHARLAVIDPDTGGFFGFVVNFEFAVNEARNSGSPAVTQNMSVAKGTSLPEMQRTFPNSTDVDAVLMEQDTSPHALLYLPEGQDWKAVAF